ncbi:hypothetical protein ARALYDRAFT_899119 [Arabidopsis lyrata subsp. lyrata]|uniref:Uncharacterized protein n=1 Tax=Arabidopsis lyrata subsp. lyrata TaxID=81972 RepID=D7L5V9_ARALL|nr:hypothetical protein ARALYDRAFT_899119 [Arabidopsis lyrata subsp. lyrata]
MTVNILTESYDKKGGISLAPGPSADDVSDYLVLAAHRTKRPDILRAFKPYHGGWNITNNHYWALLLGSSNGEYVIEDPQNHLQRLTSSCFIAADSETKTLQNPSSELCSSLVLFDYKMAESDKTH